MNRLDQAMTSIELDNVKGWPRARINIIKSLIYQELGDSANAMAEYHKYRELYKEEFPNEYVCMQGFFAKIMAEQGNIAGADSLIAEIRSIVDTIKGEEPYLAWAEGMACFGKGLDKEGLEKMQQAVKGTWYYFIDYQLAYAFYKNGMYEKAIDEFKTLGMFNEFWKAVLPYWDLKSHYYLGVCYENIGDIKKAEDEYTKFIDGLKDADFKLKELKDAQARLNRLQS